jgi:hypothetical protein
MALQVGFRRETHKVSKPLEEPVENYEINCNSVPVQQSFELIGPGLGLRYLLDGHPDFFSIAEIAKGLQRTGMCELEKALAVYRFSTRYSYVMSMGFGGYEATKFLNCHGNAFCWGQSDFQHLLYEAMGLRVRAPHLKGHSSVEVLLDGRWCTMDAFTRNLHPSPDLSHLATGADLQNHPELIEAVFPTETATQLTGYWSKAGPGTDTYEPWQDSRAMLLNLRRNERLRLDLDRREIWCLAPSEPMDYTNGIWSWGPLLDEAHLLTEVERSDGVEAAANGLLVTSAGEIEWRIQCPYPLVDGELSLVFDKRTSAQVFISSNGRRTWSQLPLSDSDRASCSWHLGEGHLSVRKVPSGAEPASLEHGAVHELFIRTGWSQAALSQMAVRFEIQAHGRSLPRMNEGVNRWTLIGGGQGTTAVHSYTVHPGLSVSNSSPLEGETVALQDKVCNWGEEPATNVRVSFQQAGTSEILGETTIDQIPAGGSATASLDWTAKAVGDRPAQNIAGVFRYVETAVEAKILTECEENEEHSPVAESRLAIRPRPAPRITGHTFQVERNTEEENITIRAALSNMPQECIAGGPHVYISDSPLSAKLFLWLGHPDRGGSPLGNEQKLEGILPAEFAVAEWIVPASEMADRAEIWLEVKCEEEVREDERRILLKRNV